MRNNIPGKILQSLRMTDNGFQFCPFCFRLLCFRSAVFSHFFIKFFYQFPAFSGEVDFSETAFVVYLYCGAVFHSLGDIVYVNIVPEYCRSVNIGAFYRCAGKADKGCIRDGVPQILGEPIGNALAVQFARIVLRVNQLCLKPVLCTMCFIGDNDDITALGQPVICRAVIFREKFLNRGKHNAAGCYFKKRFQMFP